jgi:hypothetical protein
LEALFWLKRYNPLYHDVKINKENLDWVKDEEEEILNIGVLKTKSKTLDDNDKV